MMNKNIPIFAVLLILVGIVVFQHVSAKETAANKPTAGASENAALKVNYAAPSFKLLGTDGRTYEVNGKRDKPVLLNFWASWCDPCQMEAPDLKAVYNKYKDQFDLYGVNVTSKDKLAEAQSFVKQYQLPFPILLDKDGKVSDQYRVNLIPTSYLIDRNGVVVEAFHVLSAGELERKIKKLIQS
jgi:peroxiredoxin